MYSLVRKESVGSYAMEDPAAPGPQYLSGKASADSSPCHLCQAPNPRSGKVKPTRWALQAIPYLMYFHDGCGGTDIIFMLRRSSSSAGAVAADSAMRACSRGFTQTFHTQSMLQQSRRTPRREQPQPSTCVLQHDYCAARYAGLCEDIMHIHALARIVGDAQQMQLRFGNVRPQQV